MTRLRILFAPLVLVSLAGGQTQEDPYEAIQAAMEASIERQRESVRRQAGSARLVEPSFFTVSWPYPGTVRSAETAVATEAVAPVEPDCSPIPPSQIADYVEQIAKREGFTPDLLRAVIDQESGNQPCAVSRKGAQGLMQLMPKTAAQFGVVDPFDPKDNIDAGAKFLGQLLIRFGGDVALALGAYNAGPATVDAFRGLPPIPETLNYVSDIMEKLRVEPLKAPGSF